MSFLILYAILSRLRCAKAESWVVVLVIARLMTVRLSDELSDAMTCRILFVR